MPVTLQTAIKAYRISLPLTYLNGLNMLGGAPSTVLPFLMQRQVQSQWCWAATSASVSIFYNAASSWTQCLVATKIIGTTCCVSPSGCNKPWYLDEALTATDNFSAISPPLTFQQVESELASGRVIGARVGWRGGGGHFMAIYGCKTINGINYYSIDDPIYGKSEITENAFLNAYQGAGSWTHSYITKP